MWLVGVGSMGVATGCGCKEVYRFPHTTYPYSSCIYLFFFTAASLLFVHFLKCFVNKTHKYFFHSKNILVNKTHK